MARRAGIGEGPVTAAGLLAGALDRVQWLVLVYFFGLNALYVALFLVSIWATLRHVRLSGYRDPGEILKSKLTPAVSVLVPAYNEATTIVAAVKSVFQLDYPEYEIVVINDGSDDGTLDKLVAAFKLQRTKRVYHQILPTEEVRSIYASRLAAPWAELVVIDKKRGGKADALNAGINASRYPLFCSVDADSMLERESLLRVAVPFMERRNVVGVGGIVRVANGCFISHGVVRSVGLPSRWLPRFQAVEYMRAFLSGRMAWAKLRSLLIVSGAFGLFKKKAVVEVGGYDKTTVGEDMELVVRLHKESMIHDRPCDIEFIPDPVCWTEVPERFAMLWSQRRRWQRGLAQSLARHRGVLLNPRYGRLGLVGAPYFWFVELASPVVETAGYAVFLAAALLGSLQWKALAAFLLLAVLMGVNLSLFAILLEEFSLHRYPRVRDLIGLLAAAVFENLGYRQFLSLARLSGIAHEILDRQNAWGTLERKGLDSA